MSERPNLIREDAIRLVGFVPVDKSEMLAAGAHFIRKGQASITENDEGWMSSVTFSPSLGHSIGLGFIKSGHERMGEIVTASNPLQGKDIDVEIVSPHFIDPDGERLRV